MFQQPAARASMERLRSQYETQIREAARREERARLARDLHDAIKQQLFAIQTSAAISTSASCALALTAPAAAKRAGHARGRVGLRAEGRRARDDIATALEIGEETVKTHVKHLLAKLGAENRAHAAVRALARGVVSPEDLAS